jgi:FimV-like protein
MRTITILIALFSMVPRPADSQTIGELVELGDSLYFALEPEDALEQYRAALFINAASYEALWKFARAQVDVAKLLIEKEVEAQRDSMYSEAWLYAAEAVRIDSSGADGHFMLANVLGRLSRTKGGKERVRFGREIYDEAALALELDPRHDGAEHVLGAWHAEVKRLSGITKFFAKTFLGGGYMGIASWDSAVVHLQSSVELKPDHIFHHLELAEVYIDIEEYAKARGELDQVVALPVTDVGDPRHKETAARLLKEIQKYEQP